MLRLNHSEIIGRNIDAFVTNDSKAEFQRMISEVIDAELGSAVQDAQDGSPRDSATAIKGDRNDMNIGGLTTEQPPVDEDMTDSDQSNKKQSSKKHELSVSLEADGSGSAIKKAKSNKDAELILHFHNSEPKNEDLESDTKPKPSEPGEKQVVGCAVSLSEKKGSSSSRQHDSNSSTSTVSNNQVAKIVRCRLPHAPACIIALVRGDLTNVWCELTASIRTRSVVDGDFDAVASVSNASSSGDSTETETNKGATKELLICFRPIAQGPDESGESNAHCKEDESDQKEEMSSKKDD